MKTIVNKSIRLILLIAVITSVHQLQSLAQHSEKAPMVELHISDKIVLEDGSVLDKIVTKKGNFTDEEIRAYIEEASEIEGLKERSVRAEIFHGDGSNEHRSYRWKEGSTNGLARGKAPIDFRFEFDGYQNFQDMWPEMMERFKEFEWNMPEMDITIDDEMFRLPEGIEEFHRGDMPFLIRSNQAFLGIYTEPNSGKGVGILRIVEGSPAELAGLQAGDVVLKIDGEEVTSPEQLTRIISSHKPGDEVVISLLRNGEAINQIVKLDKRKSNVQVHTDRKIIRPFDQGQIQPGFKGQWPFNKEKKSGKKSLLGVTVREMDNYDGLKVIEVEPNSPAAKAGIEIDDVIVKFDKKKVESPNHLKSLVTDKAGEQVQIELRKSNKKKKVKVHIDSSTR